MEYDVYVGCYTGKDGGEGIYQLRLDTEKKTLRKVNVFRGKALCFHCDCIVERQAELDLKKQIKQI